MKGSTTLTKHSKQPEGVCVEHLYQAEFTLQLNGNTALIIFQAAQRIFYMECRIFDVGLPSRHQGYSF
jgi:hypothetical protein